MARNERVLLRRCGGHRQQRQRERNETRDPQSKEQPFRRQSARWKNCSHLSQSHQHLPSTRYRPATLSHPIADKPIHDPAKRPPSLATGQMEAAPTTQHGNPEKIILGPVLHIPLTDLINLGAIRMPIFIYARDDSNAGMHSIERKIKQTKGLTFPTKRIP